MVHEWLGSLGILLDWGVFRGYEYRHWDELSIVVVTVMVIVFVAVAVARRSVT